MRLPEVHGQKKFAPQKRDCQAGNLAFVGHLAFLTRKCNSVLVIYDRIKHTWTPDRRVLAPADSPGTYSVWVVRITLEKIGK
jgi:hypothetical protein